MTPAQLPARQFIAATRQRGGRARPLPRCMLSFMLRAAAARQSNMIMHPILGPWLSASFPPPPRPRAPLTRHIVSAADLPLRRWASPRQRAARRGNAQRQDDTRLTRACVIVQLLCANERRREEDHTITPPFHRA
jgi:hypothetical protein